jgi:hypothetical protein
MPLPSTPHEDRAAKSEEAKERAAARKAALAKADPWDRLADYNREHGPWTETPKPVAAEKEPEKGARDYLARTEAAAERTAEGRCLRIRIFTRSLGAVGVRCFQPPSMPS